MPVRIVSTGGLQKALDRIVQNIQTASVVRVGFLEGGTYPDGTSIPLVAAVNEFGSPSRGQPPRPFFRRMIAAKSQDWSAAISNLLKTNDYDAKKALDLTGEAIAGQLRQSITDLVEPPLAPSTVRAKGFDKPLIDTSVMINSVGHEVE